MRLSLQVNEHEVERAIELVKVATQQAATDRETGLIDMDEILIGKSKKSKERLEKIKNLAIKIFETNITKFQKTTSIDFLMQEI